jgi:hypothetical protein
MTRFILQCSTAVAAHDRSHPTIQEQGRRPGGMDYYRHRDLSLKQGMNRDRDGCSGRAPTSWNSTEPRLSFSYIFEKEEEKQRLDEKGENSPSSP